MTLASEAPVEYGHVLSYTKVYFGRLYGDLEGEFQKYVNNTGEVYGESEVTHNAEAFCHYTYERSEHQLMVVDIQGVDHNLFDPEVASSTLFYANDKTIFFCCGNLSTDAIDMFNLIKAVHVCNKFCHMLKLKEM
ncbi:Transient receptor potential cation channel subfamily M member 6 [Paramuricea clavata]|uniref:Transient receptor potential cation channel subfamily M member 6 n=1 Tax=Paramuricea clavata TaxID=317549 RepID=A0A6S7G687_PARCT|nr:Transient receptor potential cation channel subfamily M member 6 [Paramuricea clavata]